MKESPVRWLLIFLMRRWPRYFVRSTIFSALFVEVFSQNNYLKPKPFLNAGVFSVFAFCVSCFVHLSNSISSGMTVFKSRLECWFQPLGISIRFILSNNGVIQGPILKFVSCVVSVACCKTILLHLQKSVAKRWRRQLCKSRLTIDVTTCWCRTKKSWFSYRFHSVFKSWVSVCMLFLVLK